MLLQKIHENAYEKNYEKTDKKARKRPIAFKVKDILTKQEIMDHKVTGSQLHKVTGYHRF